MQDIIPFDFDGHAIRTLNDDQGQTWFVARDVAKVLEYRNAPDMTRLLADDENTTHNVRSIHRGPGNPNVTLINEPGLYRAIFSSRSKKAESLTPAKSIA